MEQPRRIVVIGGVAGGATFASKARRCCPDAEIEIYDQDEFISYAGCGLPYFVGGFAPNWRKLLARLPAQFESKQNIHVFLRHRVNSIDAENKSIRVADLEGVSESSIAYDKLVIATGAFPFVPSLPGRDLQGFFVMRSMTQALELKSFIDLEAPNRVVIVGAGSIGMEMCEAFDRLGMEVHLVELMDQVMPGLDADMASGISGHLEEKGVVLHLATKVEGIEGKERVQRVVTSQGELEADLVFVCVGIRPNSGLAEKAGVTLGEKGAIRVDDAMRTNVPDILACGDCAVTRNIITGGEVWIPLGDTARKQGRVAAETVSGGPASFPGVTGTFILKTFDLAAGKTGLSLKEAADAGLEADSIEFEDSALPRYYRGGGKMKVRMSVEKQTGRVLGAQIVGDYTASVDKRLDVFATTIKAGMTASDLTSLDLSYAPPFSEAVDFPIVAGNLAEARIMGKECTCSLEGLED
ncbi:MAG: FAD-dependent oxidoreductase [Actinobacteria bacterium]|nr:FAD-dependent oxidoreductase [Actinomycetota bacterium]